MSGELRLPAPLPHQELVLADPARFKLWRAGRRTGKSRGELLAAVAGHGPVRDGQRLRRGILQGGQVAWFAPDYKQAQAIWREEIKPRFSGMPWADVSEVEKRVSVRGLGWLQLLSAENIDAARGWKLDGAIMDEAAYFDMEYALNAVIRPALADRQGWIFAGSTTNAGHDGNGTKRVPSYFNLLCERVERGELGPDWAAFHNRTEDNAKIPREEIAALRREYPEGSPIAAQELDAELGVAGGRYYDVDAERHLMDPADLPEKLPDWWEYWGAYDWGYAHWAVFGLFARDGDGCTYLVDSLWMRRQQDDAMARSIAAFCEDYGLRARSLDIYAGHDCWARTTARGASGETTADVFDREGLMLLRADIDKLNGGRAVRRLLAGVDGKPQLRLVDRPAKPGEQIAGNRHVFTQMADLVPDAGDVNKPAKVDADADGRGGDDGADMLRYGVATRIHAPTAPVRVVWEEPTARDTTDMAALMTQPESTTGDAFAGLPAGF